MAKTAYRGDLVAQTFNPRFDMLLTTTVRSGRPSSALMETAYRDYAGGHSKPCADGVVNQCAVRMSIAIGRAGGDIWLSFKDKVRIHQGPWRKFSVKCKVCAAHALGAQELADCLVGAWGAPVVVKGDACDNARTIFAEMPGVVFFQDCFTRKKGEGRVGDHIDLFDGRKYWNEHLKIGAGGSAGSGADLFKLAREVWFWSLPR